MVNPRTRQRSATFAPTQTPTIPPTTLESSDWNPNDDAPHSVGTYPPTTRPMKAQIPTTFPTGGRGYRGDVSSSLKSIFGSSLIAWATGRVRYFPFAAVVPGGPAAADGAARPFQDHEWLPVYADRLAI